jgi:hypothetical protein
VDGLPVHELSAVNGYCLRFKYSATGEVPYDTGGLPLRNRLKQAIISATGSIQTATTVRLHLWSAAPEASSMLANQRFLRSSIFLANFDIAFGDSQNLFLRKRNRFKPSGFNPLDRDLIAGTTFLADRRQAMNTVIAVSCREDLNVKKI